MGNNIAVKSLMEFSEEIENAICAWFSKAIDQTVPNLYSLKDGLIVADTLIYFDSYYKILLSNIYRDFDNCEDNQNFYLS